MLVAEKVHVPAKPVFFDTFQGQFFGILRWHQLDALWDLLKQDHETAWYVYAIGQEVPSQTVSHKQLVSFIDEVDVLLRQEHQEDYCGIVYANDREQPSMIKVFDPNHLGSVCGTSGKVTLPAWVLSTIPPVDLPEAITPPKNRQRWWQSLFKVEA